MFPKEQWTRHEGPSVTLNLNPEYLADKDFQEAEACVFPFKVKEWNDEMTALMAEGKARQTAHRIVLRRRFPLRCELEEGVYYHADQRVILESLGKIKFIRQQRIELDKIFILSHVTRNQPTANQEAARNLQDEEGIEMGENLALQCLSQKQALRRFSSPDPVPSTSSASNYWSAPPPPQPPAAASQYQIFGSQGHVPLPCSGVSLEAFPGPSHGAKHPSISVSVSSQELEEAVGKIGNFFSEDLFGLFEIPFDRLGKNVPETVPTMSSLTYSYDQFHNSPNMRTTNTCKLGFYQFGKPKKDNCNMTIYKRLHTFTGHNVPVSLREGADLLKAMIETMRDALTKIAYDQKIRDLDAAVKQFGPDKFQAMQRAEAMFAEKLRRIGKQI